MWIFYICSGDVGYATILPPQIVKTRTTYIMYILYLVLSPSQYQTFHAISQPQKPFVSAMSRMRHQVMNVGYFVRLDLRLGAVKNFSFVPVQLHVTCETSAGTQIGSLTSRALLLHDSSIQRASFLSCLSTFHRRNIGDMSAAEFSPSS
jgi:hypothetical protein